MTDPIQQQNNEEISENSQLNVEIGLGEGGEYILS
jgi:hypothetical protein